jgi:hypothetical protein
VCSRDLSLLFAPDPTDAEDAVCTVTFEINTGDEALADEDGHRVVAVNTLRSGHECFEAVVEAKELGEAWALADEWVKRREKSRRVVGFDA